MSSENSLNDVLSKKTSIFGLKRWALLGIGVGAFIVLVLCILYIWVIFRRKSRTRRSREKYSLSQIPNVSKEINIDKVGVQDSHVQQENAFVPPQYKANDKNSDNVSVHMGMIRSTDPDIISQSSSIYHHERGFSSMSGEERSSGSVTKQYALSYGGLLTASPLNGLPEFSHLGWGHWFTLRDLQQATNRFSADNIVGEGGYGVVYKGRLINGTEVAVKKILNNLGQAEKEFRVEVEAIGHVRHKNLVRLLGYCVEGVNRLAYLHEAIEPKVVHRDIKSSNILIDDEFNAKVSDFGLAKLLDSGESHITTRVMGTFGYVAPEYANSGLLNEKSDIYSFGVLLLEVITGRDPVDYARPTNEVNLVEWLKMMVGSRRAEEVVDSSLEVKPSIRVLKRVLLVALKCVDPDAVKRPKMSQVARMLEADEYIVREDRRNRRSRSASMEIESVKEPGPPDAEYAGHYESHPLDTTQR
ncbi:PREDICTED: probable receptor-like protein kinase At2g42960 isoform X2 [Lupinus angustifolius]|uniref:probable receptor-like protein kinase At2g42960 isoform X2 n=1 Tax=Lupinus angustifolius TaxID=3871 RepID=UPI00092ECFBC|nr:PREDICTED: probable receptor-like protein kinase At2g42960 isoform X2 [Lupinus angustifolius]